MEQQNDSVVRQWVGYARYESAQARAQMERCSQLLRVSVNGYLPVMKLRAKERQASKVKQCDAVPTTPSQRAVQAGVCTPAAQATFAEECHAVAPGPLALRRRLEAEVAQLWTLRVSGSLTNRATT